MLWFFFTATLFSQCGSENSSFTLTVLHYNDFHARFVETSPSGGVCNPSTAPCIGGFARLATAVRDGLQREPQSLILNGGDSFQGTLWYNLLRWNVTQEFMNLLPHDAHVLGNHEFDNGIEGLVPYLLHLNSPVVSANIAADLEPGIQGLFNRSVIVEEMDGKLGLLASSSLAHQEIAENGGPYIDIIVGGHSHTLLYNGEVPEDSAFTALGSYPVVVEQDGRPVLIVQAAAHTQYLGEIKLSFDDDGVLLDWEGNPHFLGNEIEQATDVLDKINEYLPMIDELASQEIGYSLVHLSSSCRCSECNLGNFIADAWLNSVIDRAEGENWHNAHFAIMNRGDIRSDIERGVVTFESVIISTPFENNVEVYELRGDHVLEMLEYAVANDPFAGARMLQFSGLHVTYDGSLPVNERVVNVSIRCIECRVPRYEPLELEKYYRMLSQNFVGEGGDGFTMISDNRRNVEVVGVDYVLLMDYIRQQSPVFAELEGRIQISNACMV